MHTIVHITSVHPLFDTRIYYKECSTLARAGYKTTLVVPYEEVPGKGMITIRIVPKPRSRLGRFTQTAWQAYRIALRENAQVYHFHDPELIGIGLSLKLRGKKVIYDVHEDLPRQILSKHWVPKWLRRITAWCAEFVEMVGARFFDRIVAATPTIARRFPPGKTVVVQNFPRLKELIVDNPTPYTHRPPIVAYVGGIARIRGIDEMVRAIGLLPDTEGARLVLAGSFNPPELEGDLRRRTEWERVDFLGWQSREGIRRLLSKARVGLVTLHPIPNYLDSYPVKLFEYMSVGIPVVASDFPLWREIVEGAGCGLLVDPLNPTEIANAILWLLEHPAEAQAMGERGREAVRVRYNWSIEAQKLLQMYRELTL